VTAEEAEDVRFVGKWVFFEALGRLRQNPDGIWFKDLVDDMLDADAALDPRTLVGFLARAFGDDSRIVRGPFRGVFGHVPLRGATAPHPRATEWTEAAPRTNVVKDRYRGTTTYVRVLRELVRTAEQGDTTGFGDFAVLMGVGPVGASTGREVSQVLAEISEDEVNRGRPMLGAVVVGSKGQPSAGARSAGLP
jgi:alkylated DNA nucleotide flippase Atl1